MTENPVNESLDLRSVDDLINHATETIQKVTESAYRERLAALGLFADQYTWAPTGDPVSPHRIMVTLSALDLCQLLEERRDEAAQAQRALEFLGRKLDTLTAARETSETED